MPPMPEALLKIILALFALLPAIFLINALTQAVKSHITVQPIRSENTQTPSCRLVCPGYNEYQSYCLCETNRLVQGRAIIYSFGVGEDISFEEALIRTYHVWCTKFSHLASPPTLINYLS